MESEYEYNHIFNENKKHIMEYQEKLSDDAFENMITDEQLEQIQPYTDHKSPSPTMNSGIMDV